MRALARASPRPGDRRPAPGLLTAFAAVAAGLVILTLTTPSWAVPLRFAAASWAVAALAVGVVVHDPPHKSVWLALAGAVVAFQFSDLGHLDRRVLSADWSQWLSLAGYPLAVVAFSAMVRLRSAGRDAAGLLDAAVATAALLVPTWVFLVQPYVHADSWTAVRLEAILPPIGDVVLLGLLLRLLAAPAARSRSLWLLAAGVVATAACDVGQGLLQLGAASWFGTSGGQRLIALGGLSFNLLWGAAALSPDMRGNTEPTPAPKPVVLPARIIALTLAALAEPAVAVVLLSQSRYHLGVFGPLVEITIVLLIMVRVSLVLADHRRALRRERILVSATGPLVTAAGADEIAAVLAATATRLAGPGTRHEIAVVVADQNRFHVGTAEVSYSTQDTDPDGKGWRETLSTLAQSTHTAGRTPRLVPVETLPKALRDTLAGFDHALVLPLGTEAWRADVWAAGALAAAASEDVLLGLAAPLEILTGQAALSLQRLALGMEIARRDGERYFQALVQNDSDAILIVDTDARVRYASPSAEAMFSPEYSADPSPGVLLGRPVADLIGRIHAGQIADLLADPARHAPRRRDWVLDASVPDAGSRREVEATISDLRAEPTVNGLVLALRDVTTARDLERMLQRQAFHDELTDLPNRAAFVRRLDGVRDRAGPDGQVCVVLVDVDHFREINDFHGRDVGDAVLRATADLLRQSLGPGDVLARVGGDEFAILRVRRETGMPRFPIGIPGETDPFHVGPVAVTTSGALVVAGAGAPGGPDTSRATGAELLADAEITLHAAKEPGQPRSWRRYDPALRTALARVTERRSGLDRALAEGEFTLRYQPIVHLADRTLAGFESLIRWPQPDGSVVMPDEFIALAEATGQILPMGRWTLHTAAVRAAAWNRTRAAAGMSPVHVAVNVSAHELRAPTFPETVAAALAASGLGPERLILEATESSLIDHADRALPNLRAVRDLGVRLALDDFGTGYSSLSYLCDLPVTILKIDKGFTAEVGRHARQAALVEGIVGIGRALGLSVIAEGIETEDQYRRMSAMGVDLGQGWLFGKPLADEEAEELVRTMP